MQHSNVISINQGHGRLSSFVTAHKLSLGLASAALALASVNFVGIGKNSKPVSKPEIPAIRLETNSQEAKWFRAIYKDSNTDNTEPQNSRAHKEQEAVLAAFSHSQYNDQLVEVPVGSTLHRFRVEAKQIMVGQDKTYAMALYEIKHDMGTAPNTTDVPALTPDNRVGIAVPDRFPQLSPNKTYAVIEEMALRPVASPKPTDKALTK